LSLNHSVQTSKKKLLIFLVTIKYWSKLTTKVMSKQQLNVYDIIDYFAV